jgi:predicted phosphodiesterase
VRALTRETVRMRVAIVSDIHGNRQAFEAVLDAIEASGCQEMWCLGDLVGYGADPNACVELAREHAAICLAGNHDLGVRGTLPLEQFSRGAALAATWTQGVITAETRAFLDELEPVNLDEIVGLYHASPRDPVWEYVLSPLQAELCLDVQPDRVALIGHSHVALSFARFPGEPATGETRVDGTLLTIAEGEWLLNPGSVGQPRDGDPRAAWLSLDLDNWTADYHRVEYDIAGAAAAIRAARLPDSLAERLLYGQ